MLTRTQSAELKGNTGAIAPAVTEERSPGKQFHSGGGNTVCGNESFSWEPRGGRMLIGCLGLCTEHKFRRSTWLGNGRQGRSPCGSNRHREGCGQGSGARLPHRRRRTL